jgi:hypothetical protein
MEITLTGAELTVIKKLLERATGLTRDGKDTADYLIDRIRIILEG